MTCNLENDKLDSEEFKRIEQQCKIQKHIDINEDLMKLIEDDQEIINKRGLDMKDIKNYLEKLLIHISLAKKNKAKYPETEYTKKAFSKLNARDWTCWKTDIAKIFNNSLTVLIYSWCGIEKCPFTSPKYNIDRECEYGDRNYVFVRYDKEYLHMSSLTMHQIIKHNFFQGLNSSYRVSPETIIDFFRLKPQTNYETSYKIIEYPIYEFTCAISSDEIEEINCNETLIERQQYNGYSFLKYKDNKEDKEYYRFYISDPNIKENSVMHNSIPLFLTDNVFGTKHIFYPIEIVNKKEIVLLEQELMTEWI
ncbi:hypothetical protein Catovirus_1_431 [Catovirus CTV1]|uniref:Uncharacterized protein n=1 Tax=Catovirus CTV1 TaxID=1977631 RepID=A0A1V0S9K9_9VIRU|nr:hypothetical protein Catovirus_1_431 [Catovirus CTV1]